MSFGGISIGNSILFGQVGNLLGGLFLSLLGMGLLYTQLYWRRKALTVEAEVIGVRQAGLNVHTVYRFALPSGEIHQATSAQGSTSLGGRDTGRRVQIQVMPDRPDEVRESGSATIWALTIGSLAAGAWLTWLALTSWPATLMMWIVLAGAAFYLGAVVRFLDRTGSNPAPYKVGDHVAVLYKPEDPSSTAMIDRGARDWVPVGMLLLFGGTFAALGLFSLRAQ